MPRDRICELIRRGSKNGTNHQCHNRIVRLSTWRDRLSVCGEWKKDDFDRDMIEAYLKDVVDLMLIIVDS